MSQINAYLTFNGNCAEVMTFYKECIGGQLSLQTIEGSPMAGQFPDHMKKSVLHSDLTKDGMVLLASDMAGPDGITTGNNITLSLNCSTNEELNTYFSNLSNGGQVLYPLHDFFAGRMGQLIDRYGLKWSLYHNNQA